MEWVLIAGVICLAGLQVLSLRQGRELHMTMNSRLDQLLVTTEGLARAEGFKAGQEDHLVDLRAAGKAYGGQKGEKGEQGVRGKPGKDA